MITEKGTIKVETALDENVQKEFMKKLFIVSLFCLIIGCVMLAAYIVWDVTAIILQFAEPNISVLIIGAGAFAFGLIFVISRNKVIKATRLEQKKEVYEFFNNYVVAEDYLNGEQVATVKIYYNKIIRRKETANYLFFYVQAAAACAVGKAGMTEGELNAVRSLLGIAAKGGAGINLPMGAEDASSDPFAESAPAEVQTDAEKPAETTENKSEE